MFSIEKQVDIAGSRQVYCKAEHSVRMTLAEKGGRAIMRVLSKDARIVAISAVPVGVDVEVSGKVIVSAVCEIAGGDVVCLDYMGNFNFSHKATAVNVPASCDINACVGSVRVLRASGCEVVCEVDFEIMENFSVNVSEPCVVSAVDCYSSVRNIKGVSSRLKVHNFSAVCEVVVEAGVGLVLAQQFYVESTGVSARDGSVVCSGNVHGWFSYLDLQGAVCRTACSFPFREEFSCENADEYAVLARGGECSVVCEVNEVREQTVASCEVEVELSLWGYTSAEFECGSDFFSDKLEISAEHGEFVCSDFCGLVQSLGKFSQAVDWAFDKPTAVTVVSARVGGVERKGDGALFVGNVICTIASSDMKFQEFVLPYEIDFPIGGDGKVGVCDVVISEISARMNGDKVEVYGRVCGNLLLMKERRETVVSALFAGAEKQNISGGFVLYRAEEGESLLDICSAIGVMPALLKAQNPKLVFPIPTNGAKVVVWKGGE